MIQRCVIIAIVLICLLAVSCGAIESNEMFRIRVENSDGGRVQVSIDEGKNYTTVGYVNRHAVSTYRGFPASAYAPSGTVAATAVHGIRLKIDTIGDGKTKKPMTISLVPAEFSTIPAGYGGHIPYGSGIYTDIPAGTAIFRTFAPLVENPVKIEKRSELKDIPHGWQPADGDVIVIIAKLPKPYLSMIEFENRKGGAVTATYSDGGTERIATVLRPVKGVGRFDGTSYTGVGLMNTNHSGVVTISTAPVSTSGLLEGTGPERRGGFEIQPSEHAKTQPPMPQAMVVGPIKDKEPLEGNPPIFSNFIGLAFDPNDPRNSVRAEVEIKGKWQPMPKLVGKLNTALSDLGVTGIRILFPKYDHEFLARLLAENSIPI